MIHLRQPNIICVGCEKELTRNHTFCDFCGTTQPQPEDFSNKRFIQGKWKVKHSTKFYVWCERCKSFRRRIPKVSKQFCYRCGNSLSMLSK